MRTGFALVLVAGIGLAGAAVYMAKGYIGQTQSALEQQQQILAALGPITQVYVLKTGKNYGDPLTAEDVELVYMPANSLPEGTFGNAETLFPPGPNQGRFVLRQMEPREPILQAKVTGPGEPPGLAGQLERGKRAFAIKVDVQSGVSGFLQPGNFVDVFWTGNSGGPEGEITRLIESKARVIAVDQTSDASGGALVARTITVAVTPEQVARLTQAQSSGRLTLSLVGQDDEAVTSPLSVDNASITGRQEVEVVVAPEEQRCTITQMKGGERVVVEIPCTN
ncbi:MAG: Flp pilus assembly protein CpaB [Cypionkella sp.]|nr:Flp pilus assembly protein CpaB [Cypionkella sp.]